MARVKGDLNCKSDEITSFEHTNAVTDSTFSAGDMYVIEDTIGVFLEDVGTSGAAVGGDGAAFPHGPKGSFIYQAKSIYLPKEAGASMGFTQGDKAYFNAVTATSAELTTVSTGNTLAAIAQETVATDAEIVLCELVVLA